MERLQLVLQLCIGSSAQVWFAVSHGMIEWLGLEGTPRITKFQPSCYRQGCQPLDQILDQIPPFISNKYQQRLTWTEFEIDWWLLILQNYYRDPAA